MLSKNKIFFVLFLLVMVSEIFAPHLVKPLDELMLMLFLLVIVLDLLVNHDFRRYKSLFVLEGVFLFYFVFSALFRDFNTVGAMVSDFILEQKAFIPFIITYTMAPTFSRQMKYTLKAMCIAIIVVLVVIFCTGMTESVLSHVYHYGTIAVSVTLLYLYCSIGKDGKVSRRDMVIAMVLLSAGLMSTRSKFYGEYMLALFMFFVYRPGMVRHMNIKHALVAIIGVLAVIGVGWSKFEYYFISGNSDSLDADLMETFARPALYVTMVAILLDYPIFGSGLASFASHSSSSVVNYSEAYVEYGIDNIYGLSYRMSDFVSDTYYPVLAQFGFVGIALFVWFWSWIWKKLRIVLHSGRVMEFSIGVMVIGYFLIESIASATLLQIGGYLPLMLLGMIVSGTRTMDKEEKDKILSNDYN